MGEVIGTCGHYLKSIDGNALSIKEFNKEGDACICHVYVCDECAAEYEYGNLVLHNKTEQDNYLYGEGTVESVIETMEDRGYSLSSHMVSSIYIFGKTVDDISINATVNIKEKDSTVEFSYHGLKMLMQINVRGIAFDHPQFERFERVLLHYAKICNDNDPFKIGL